MVPFPLLEITISASGVLRWLKSRFPYKFAKLKLGIQKEKEIDFLEAERVKCECVTDSLTNPVCQYLTSIGI